MAGDKDTEREKQLNKILRVSPEVAAMLDKLSSNKDLRDLTGRFQEIHSRLPKD